jgi:hypothetical protein
VLALLVLSCTGMMYSNLLRQRSLVLIAGVGLRLLGEGVLLLPLPGVLGVVLLLCLLRIQQIYNVRTRVRQRGAPSYASGVLRMILLLRLLYFQQQ